MYPIKLIKPKAWKFLLILCLTSNTIWSQGPNAPEAASFEPIDVTDAVNLVTGDFTYTLPAIYVPGPNGGYPLTLSYHAGIAMKQESSWVGLGWSINPGAINRNVNGYPDDWNNVKNYEYYWNKGETLRQHTLDVSIPIYGVTIGLGASWGSLRGFSGSVGIGYGPVYIEMGSEGASVGVGINNYVSIEAGLNNQQGGYIGVTAGTGGTINQQISVGYSQNNQFYAQGSTSLNASFETSSGAKINGSVGITTSGAVTYGIGASLQNSNMDSSSYGETARAGSGGSYFSTTLQKENMTINHSGYTIPLILINYRYEKVKWFVDALKKPGISGSIYSDNNILNTPQDVIDYCESVYGRCYRFQEDRNPTSCECIEANGEGYGYTGTQPNPDYAFSDVSAIQYLNNPKDFSILKPHPSLLNKDIYNVSGQGISGPMSPKLMKNITLVNVNHDYDEADLSYYKPESSTSNVAANFYFDNELTGGALINKVSYSDVNNPTNFDSYITQPTNEITGEKRSGKYIEYFTYDNIPSDLILPDNFNQPQFVKEGAIAGYRITSSDGIVYTYMLPVYSIMEKFRLFNYLDIERDIYSEKTNEAYATHWLLTSITGPDYIDSNTNGKLDELDYGYWVSFDYGKWSEGMVWRNPSKIDEYSKYHGNRRYAWGLKEIYYLDKITTRTHSALFLKELREDSKGVPQKFIYKNESEDYIMPSQKQLKLSKIILIQNSKLQQLNKTNSSNIVTSPNSTYSFYDPKIQKTYNFSLNLQDNVLDTKDIQSAPLEQIAIRVIDFKYDYSLAENSANTDALGKLTLKNIFFKGKKGLSLSPPYSFNYTNNPSWEYDNENYWGYNNYNSSAWSLDEIITPVGTKININYEADMYRHGTSEPHYAFRDVEVNANANALLITADIGNYNLKEGDEIRLDYSATFSDCANLNIVRAEYFGKVSLIRISPGINNHKTLYRFELTEPDDYSYEILNTYQNHDDCSGENLDIGGAAFRNISGIPFKHKSNAGIRVAQIKVSDGINELKTAYEYSTGSVPYEPYYNFKGVTYQSLMRSANVLYDKVTVKNLDNNDNLIDNVQTIYEFYTDKYYPQISNRILSQHTYPNITNSFNENSTQGVEYNFKDYQSIIGSLKQISVYQKNTLLRKNINHYKFLDENSGLVNSESTQMYKSVNPKPGNDKYQKQNHLISTSLTKYPLILESHETIQGTFKEISHTSDKRDINSGQLLESLFVASDGKEYKTEIIPAYKKYGAMGSKVDNPSNKNMLTQEAMTKTYIKVGDDWKETGVGITTWKPQTYVITSLVGSPPNQTQLDAHYDVWRKHKTFTWDGDTDDNGIFIDFSDDDDGFNWSLDASLQPNQWKQLSEVSKYDHYSMPLETIDINGNKAATKMGDSSSKIFVTGTAGYNEIFYSGAEDDDGHGNFGGEVNKSTATVASNLSNVHTGSHSLKITSGQTGYQVTVTPNTDKTTAYKISLWTKYGAHENVTINGVSAQRNTDEDVRAGDWIQLNFYTEINTQRTISIGTSSSTIYVDDFRIHPVTATMVSYVYNQWDELTHIIGANNLATAYKYDAMGRLIETLTEIADYDDDNSGVVENDEMGNGGFKKITENKYTYKY